MGFSNLVTVLNKRVSGWLGSLIISNIYVLVGRPFIAWKRGFLKLPYPLEGNSLLENPIQKTAFAFSFNAFG